MYLPICPIYYIIMYILNAYIRLIRVMCIPIRAIRIMLVIIIIIMCISSWLKKCNPNSFNVQKKNDSYECYDNFWKLLNDIGTLYTSEKCSLIIPTLKYMFRSTTVVNNEIGNR